MGEEHAQADHEMSMCIISNKYLNLEQCSYQRFSSFSFRKTKSFSGANGNTRYFSHA